MLWKWLLCVWSFSSNVSSLASHSSCFRIGIVGGGASGMFAAAQVASAVKGQDVDVVVLEGSPKIMSKVEKSGGGRCNVLHDTSKPVPVILDGYPRGKKELNGIMTKYFGPTQARRWFEKRGVELKTESDGRMFPVTDSSQTIMDAISSVAEENGAFVKMRVKVMSVEKRTDSDGPFILTCNNGIEEIFDILILATGSSPGGYRIASSLGHSIVDPVPSLFTFNAKHQIKEGGLLHGLSGLSVKETSVTLKMKVPGKKRKKVITQEGPLLFTHHGISGPSVLRLSAFAAREFHDINYQGNISINWAPRFGPAENIESVFIRMAKTSPKRTVASSCPLVNNDGTSAIPRRLWSKLVSECGFNVDSEDANKAVWGEAPKKKLGALSRAVTACEVSVTGKGTFKEEFVTAGGIKLKEITMNTMESKICPGLYFCGEMIDVDGVTGGFNFMNCWGTGFVAGTNAAKKIMLMSQSGDDLP